MRLGSSQKEVNVVIPFVFNAAQPKPLEFVKICKQNIFFTIQLQKAWILQMLPQRSKCIEQEVLCVNCLVFISQQLVEGAVTHA